MIDILMATYNGAEFIENQILSLLSQTFKDWKLIIHDDGSTDQTLTIVRKYLAFDSRITLIEDGITFGNAGMNFMHLLKNSTAEYIIFCDQDDIWFENKLMLLFESISVQNNFKIRGVYCGGYLYSKEKNLYGALPTLKPQSLKDFLFLNAGIQGCAVIFNNECREIMLQYKGYISMHDHLLTAVLLNFGNIVYKNDNVMLYRQNHVNKVTSNVEVNLVSKIKKQIFSKRSVIESNHFRLNYDFYMQFNSELSESNKTIFNNFFKIVDSKSYTKRILLILSNGFNIGGSSIYLCLKILMRPMF